MTNVSPLLLILSLLHPSFATAQGIEYSPGATDPSHLTWNTTGHVLNIIGGDGVETGGVWVTRLHAGDGGLSTGLSLYRLSTFNGGTPTANDIVNLEFLLQDANGTHYTMGAVGGKITSVTPGNTKGGTVLYYHSGIAPAYTYPGAFLDYRAWFKIGDDQSPEAPLHVKGNVVLLDDAGNGASYSLRSQGQRWNMSVDANKGWMLYDQTAGTFQMRVSPGAWRVGPMVTPAASGTKRFLCIDSAGYITSQVTACQ